jgi:thiosulfate/3-mercaptopyruvate sulfurtransferase
MPGTERFQALYGSVSPLVWAPELQASLSGPQPMMPLDCRHDLNQPDWGQAQYALGHIPDARFAHLDRDLAGAVTPHSGRHPLPEMSAFRARLQAWGITPETHVVAYDGSGGCYAARAWWLLRWAGHTKVSLLNGGWQAWLDAGGQSCTGLPASHAAPPNTAPETHPTRKIDGDGLAMIVSDPDLAAQRILLDARAPDRFRGENETIDPIAGHIPGAVNHFWKNNLDHNGYFKVAPHLRQTYEAILDGKPARAIISQCGSGVTACHNIFAIYLAGLGESTLYPGSWSEWITDPDRPVSNGAD